MLSAEANATNVVAMNGNITEQAATAGIAAADVTITGLTSQAQTLISTVSSINNTVAVHAALDPVLLSASNTVQVTLPVSVETAQQFETSMLNIDAMSYVSLNLSVVSPVDTKLASQNLLTTDTTTVTTHATAYFNRVRTQVVAVDIISSMQDPAGVQVLADAYSAVQTRRRSVASRGEALCRSVALHTVISYSSLNLYNRAAANISSAIYAANATALSNEVASFSTTVSQAGADLNACLAAASPLPAMVTSLHSTLEALNNTYTANMAALDALAASIAAAEALLAVQQTRVNNLIC